VVENTGVRLWPKIASHQSFMSVSYGES